MDGPLGAPGERQPLLAVPLLVAVADRRPDPGFGPTVYAVRWKENVYLGMVVHCTLNTLGIILVASSSAASDFVSRLNGRWGTR